MVDSLVAGAAVAGVARAVVVYGSIFFSHGSVLGEGSTAHQHGATAVAVCCQLGQQAVYGV